MNISEKTSQSVIEQPAEQAIEQTAGPGTAQQTEHAVGQTSESSIEQHPGQAAGQGSGKYERTGQAMEELQETVARLRAPDGCPWDRAQDHLSLKAACVEEAAEVVSGINILAQTGKAHCLKEELGDLLLQVVMHAQIADEEGLFTMEDVIRGIPSRRVCTSFKGKSCSNRSRCPSGRLRSRTGQSPRTEPGKPQRGAEGLQRPSG